jgi:hypothetical protein
MSLMPCFLFLSFVSVRSIMALGCQGNMGVAEDIIHTPNIFDEHVRKQSGAIHWTRLNVDVAQDIVSQSRLAHQVWHICQICQTCRLRNGVRMECACIKLSLLILTLPVDAAMCARWTSNVFGCGSPCHVPRRWLGWRSPYPTMADMLETAISLTSSWSLEGPARLLALLLGNRAVDMFV